MHSLLQDLRHAFRLLAKNPGFTAVAVVVLALGIGANTAVFSIVNILVLKPIPTDGSDVVGIFAKDRTRPDQYRAFSWADYQAVRGARELFDNVLAHTMSMVGISEGERTRRSFVGVVSANYFSTLGVQLAAGREFTADEERPGANQLVVIGGFQLARKAGATPAEMIGRTLRINAREYTIVGMAPEGFSGTTALVSPEVWLPLGAYERVSDEMFRDGQDASLANPKTRPLMLIGRLRRGIAADAAAPMLATVTAWLARADPAENANFELMVTHLPRLSISTSPRSEDGTGVLTALLMGMAAMVLLIACLNLANMLLARGTARRKEIALRLALGSGRGRVVRQLLT
jgi:hypothetical protein